MDDDYNAEPCAARFLSVFVAIFRYLICVNTHMKELKPFGDVPKKLSVQVKRSFVATRTFTQALNVGRDVISKMQSVMQWRRGPNERKEKPPADYSYKVASYHQPFNHILFTSFFFFFPIIPAGDERRMQESHDAHDYVPNLSGPE